MSQIPERIVIPHDDHHGRYAGKTPKGHQFFITTPFVWLEGSREFVALYLFNSEGDLIDAIIDDLGGRGDLIGDTAARVLPGNIAQTNSPVEDRITRRLEYLGEVTYQNIEVKLFELERHGVRFGLFPRLAEEEDVEEEGDLTLGECLSVDLQPGDYMAFTPPWDGDYDT